jgi:hypothetical protein
MAELNPFDVIAEGINRAKATADRETVGHILAETLAALQIDNDEVDALSMLNEAIGEAASQDAAGCTLVLDVWSELQAPREAP